MNIILDDLDFEIANLNWSLPTTSMATYCYVEEKISNLKFEHLLIKSSNTLQACSQRKPKVIFSAQHFYYEKEYFNCFFVRRKLETSRDYRNCEHSESG